MRDTCPQCRGPKGMDFDLCYACAEELREYGREPVGVSFLRVTGETPKAWRVLLDDSNPFAPKTCWIPKSIGDVDEVACEATVPRWFAEQEYL